LGDTKSQEINIEPQDAIINKIEISVNNCQRG